MPAFFAAGQIGFALQKVSHSTPFRPALTQRQSDLDAAIFWGFVLAEP
jgi:hypothetical protein